MTLASTTPKEIKNGNGVTTVFSFTFVINQASDLVVVKTATDGTETTLTEGTGTSNYSVSVSAYPGSGSITYPATLGTELASGEKLTLKRVVDLDQETDLINQGAWKPEQVESALDYARMVDLQQQDDIDRSIKVQVSDDSGADFTLPAPAANKVIGIWNADADAIIAGPTADQISSAQTYASNAATSASAAATSETNSATSETNAAASAAAAQAAVGAVKVSSNDTTAGDLETKLLPGSGLAASTQNDGGNETRALTVDPNNATDTVITTADEILFADTSDSNNVKKDTVQGILDLVVSADQVARDMAASALAYVLAQNDATSITGTIGKFYLSDDFETDSLATKTNATYDATGDNYNNTPTVEVRITGATPSAPLGGTAANINDDNTGTSATTGALSDTTGQTIAQRTAFKLDLGSVRALTKVEVLQISQNTGSDSSEIYTSEDDVTYTVYGTTIGTSSTPADYTRTVSRNARYVAIVLNESTFWAGRTMTLADLNAYELDTPANMTLAPTATTLATANPLDLLTYVVINPQEAITAGTDIVMTASIDGGITDATGTWTKVGDIGSGGEELWRVEFDVSAQTGSSLTYEITTTNNKEIQYHDCIGLVALY